jgi:hypothetical protein
MGAMLIDILKRDETREFLLKAGGTPYPGDSDLLLKRLLARIESWKRAITLAKIEQL